jgi:ubiquinone/menaquinone biosynthesis C-methylase UbiE
MLEYRELESAVLPTYWTAVLEWVGAAAADLRPQRILDLGAGTGIASLALAKRFTDAEVIALDMDGDALELVRAKAGKALVADRVVTLEADLDQIWPDLVDLDLTWASMSLHHLAEPERVLRQLYENTRPGGHIAVAEMGEHLRLLPDDLGVGRAGLEARCLDAQAAEHARTLPTLGSSWDARLRDAGFGVLDERTVPLDEAEPELPATARFAELRLERFRSGLAGALAADDVDALATLLDAESPSYVGRRTDFVIRGARALTLGAR